MSDHYFPWLDEPGPLAERLGDAGRGRPGDRARRADDLRDLPDHALPPGGRRAAGRDGRPAQRRAVPLGLGRRGEPQRARRRAGLAAGQRPARDARRGGEDHPRAVRRRVRQLRGRATSGSTSAKLWDVAEQPPADRGRGVRDAVGRAGRAAGRRDDRGRARRRAGASSSTRAGGTGKPRIGQVPICWDPDRDAAIERAHDQFRWFGGGWKVNAELPGPAAFAGATPVRPPARTSPSRSRAARMSTRTSMRCAAFVTRVSPTSPSCRSAARRQPDFLDWAERELLPALRQLAIPAGPRA